jgi:hypothetical protein
MFKKMIFILILVIPLIGCGNDINVANDNIIPVPPQGLIAVAQDRQVYLSWYKNYETDVVGYNIYVSNSYRGKYTKIGFTSKTEFYDKSVTNGVTYYYAVTAYDHDGNESDFSIDESFATPRPEVFNVTIYDYKTNPTKAGYAFGSNAIVAYNSNSADIYFENSNGIYYIVVYKDSDIQDMGYTSGFDEIFKSPTKGWSPTKDVQAIVGHTYVIWTYDNHYAKIRVAEINPDRIVFDCSFQLQTGNPYLKRNVSRLSNSIPFGKDFPHK